MNKKRGTVALTALAALFSVTIQQADACTRATYIGPENLVITGRTMDWKEDIMSNIYVFPRGIQRAGYNKGETVKWTSKYGSVIATGYDIGTCDGMNEKGLVAGLLFLPESVYDRPGDTRPVMGISIWTQYVLGQLRHRARSRGRTEEGDFPHRRSPNAQRLGFHPSSGYYGRNGEYRYPGISGRETKHPRGQGIPGDDQLAQIRVPIGRQRLLEGSRRIADAARNQPLQRPLCTRVILHSCHSADSRRGDCSPQRIECDA